MTACRSSHDRARRGAGVRRPARRVHRPARPAAPPAPRGADRDRRHPDRADRRPVPSGHPRARPQPGRRLSRDGEPAGAPQGADAAAASRSEDDGWEDPRAELVRRLLEYQQIREIALWMGRAAERRAEQFARGYLPPPPEAPPPPLTLDLMDLLAGGRARHRGDPDAGAAPRRRAAARRRRRHPPDRGAAGRARGVRLARGARPPAHDRGSCSPPCWPCSSWPSGVPCV